MNNTVNDETNTQLDLEKIDIDVPYYTHIFMEKYDIPHLESILTMKFPISTTKDEDYHNIVSYLDRLTIKGRVDNDMGIYYFKNEDKNVLIYKTFLFHSCVMYEIIYFNVIVGRINCYDGKKSKYEFSNNKIYEATQNKKKVLQNNHTELENRYERIKKVSYYNDMNDEEWTHV